MQSSRKGLKTGNRPVQQQLRTYKPGDTLFTEGSTGRELFIIHEGTVGIYKDGSDGRIELARVERGGIIGEMALLDALPRSATGIAIDKVTALIIGYAQFQKVMQLIPMWLQSIIKIVVSRLRDANRRVDQSTLRNKERGLIALIRLLFPVAQKIVDSLPALPYDTVVSEAYYICRLRKKEVVKLLDTFEKRSIISIVKENEPAFIKINDREVLQLFEEYLVLKDQKRTFKEIGIPKDAINMLSNIAYVAQKVGRETEEGTYLQKSALIEDLSLKDTGNLEKQLIDLSRRNLINVLPVEGDTAIIFQKESLSRIKKIQEWLPRFTMEVT